MTRNARTVATVATCASAAIILATQGTTLLVVNGKKTENGVYRDGDQTYVSLKALQAAGAEVSITDARVSVQFKPLNDQLQTNAAEGVIGDWVQNGGWRVKVHSVTPAQSPFGKGGGFEVKFEFRNLSSKPMNFGASGLKLMQVMDDNGVAMRYSLASFKDLYKAAAPGGGFTNVIKFGMDAGDTRPLGKASKMIILFGQSGKNRFKDIRIDLSEM